MKSFRSKVFKRAHEIMRSTGKSFAVCLSKAWAVYRLAKRMTKEAVSFSFEKANGELKSTKGTLMNISCKIKGTGKVSSKVFCYWDLVSNSFRSFRSENLITVF